ncbi:MAG: hypothetical protein DHS20C02_00080 [Micavibrio sp.]|nr:MAG: hypothetical protein DHS20C02_00080 [Micavibrio sp.]
MGSLASRPVVPPSQPQVVFIPSPTVTTTQATSGSGGSTNTSTNTGGTGTSSGDPSASEQRTGSLLQRGRGRFGTIQTSFRGLLSAASAGGQRKTLLGE